jgi:lycopene cyclase domain-containing protein
MGLLLQLAFKIRLFNSFKEGIVFFLLVWILTMPMDFYAVSKGIWSFPGTGTIGIRVFNVPIEENLFMIVVPYFVIVLYKIVNKKLN